VRPARSDSMGAPCEKRLDGDPARAAYFTIIRDGRSIWIICRECGAKERLNLG